MKSSILGLGLALLGAFAVLPAHAQTAPVVVGEKTPDYKFTDVTGKTQSIAGLKGKMIVLEWTNPGCPFVKHYYTHGDMQKLQQAAADAKDTVWVSINSSAVGKEGYLASDAEAKAQIAADKSHAAYYVRDPSGAFGKLYGAKSTPHMFVIDKAGIVAYQGAIDSEPSTDASDIAKATPYVTQALDALRKGGKPATVSTPAYGCGVKYDDHAGTPDPTHGALKPSGGKAISSGTDARK